MRVERKARHPGVIEALERRRLLSGAPPHLVVDLNTGPATGRGGGQFTVHSGGVTFFTYTNGVDGAELWRTDGTAAGTSMVRDTRPGAASGTPLDLCDVGGTLFFTADDGIHGRELWRSDGTAAGTYMVVDQPDSVPALVPQALTNVNGTLFFVAGNRVYKSDGTAGGTAMVTETKFNHVSAVIDPATADLTAIGDTLYFAGQADDTSGFELWRTDGTDAGTVMVKDIAAGFRVSSSPAELTNVNGTLYFVATTSTSGRELWKTDGTDAGTVLVAEIGAGSDPSDPVNLTNVDGTLFFSAFHASSGRELWKSDGTAAGTVLVRNIGSGIGFSSNPQGMTAVGGTLFFSANDGVNGRELWRSDGSGVGTVMVRDLRPGTASSSGFNSLSHTMTAFDGKVYFRADGPTSFSDLWVSDGTYDGTFVLAAETSAVSNIAAAGGLLYYGFGANRFASDGTASDVRQVTGLEPMNGSSNPQKLVSAGGYVYFAVAMSGAARGLWRTDGTADGTEQLYGNTDSAPVDIVGAGSRVFFTTAGGRELWRTDGTAASTQLLRRFATPLKQLTVMNGVLYFVGKPTDVEEFGEELWRSDGTADGTRLVHDSINATNAPPLHLVAMGNHLYYWAHSSDGWYHIWRSDGTAQGTEMVSDLPPGANPTTSQPSRIAVMGDRIYFAARASLNGVEIGRELFSSDGTAAGTRLVKDINAGQGSAFRNDLSDFQFTLVAADTLYFTADDGTHGTQIWRTDGTEPGTQRVTSFAQAGGGFTPPHLASFTAAGGQLYFVADHPTAGRELFRTAGTPATTAVVADLVAGAGSSYPTPLRVVGDTLYFSATDDASGVELWRTDGTAVGTAQVADLNPGAGSSTPAALIDAPGGALFFAANDAAHGDELWTIPAPPPAWLDAGAGAAYTLTTNALTVTAGGVTITADASSTHRPLDVIVHGGAAVTFAAAQHLGLLDVRGGGSASVTPGGNQTIVADGLLIADGATLDLTDNDLLVRHADVGAWNGAAYTGVTGLIAAGKLRTTTPAAQSGLTMLAVADASQILDFSAGGTQSWNGHTVDADTVIVKYTYGGDTNFDGKLDADDYGTIDFNVLVAGSFGYYAGDFNFDGKVDVDDYGVIDFNVLAQDDVL